MNYFLSTKQVHRCTKSVPKLLKINTKKPYTGAGNHYETFPPLLSVTQMLIRDMIKMFEKLMDASIKKTQSAKQTTFILASGSMQLAYCANYWRDGCTVGLFFLRKAHDSTYLILQI